MRGDAPRISSIAKNYGVSAVIVAHARLTATRRGVPAIRISAETHGSAERHQSINTSVEAGQGETVKAMLARGAAEAKLADYAMNGVEEEVWYHGDLVGSRKRVSDRLLLAHLARLDRLTQNPATHHAAIGFDTALDELLDAPEMVQHYADEEGDRAA